MTMRLQETEGFAGQAVRAAAKASMSARRDPLPIQRFALEDERGAAERSRLERTQTDRKTDADLVERRAEQRNLDRRAASVSMSERRAERPEQSPEGRDQGRSTEQVSMSVQPAKPDTPGISPAGSDPVAKDDEKAKEAPSEARSPQDAPLPAMISPPLPLGRVLAEAASSPAGRDIAVTASEPEEHEASTKLDREDGRGREEPEGRVTQAQEAHGKDVATAAVSVSPLLTGTPPPSASAGPTQTGSRDGTAPGTPQRVELEGQSGHGTAPAMDSAGTGSAAIQTAATETASATPAGAEPRDGGSTFADLLTGASTETAKEAIPASVPAASGGTIAANSISEPPASLPTPHQGAPVPLGAVPMTIGLRSLSGSSHFEIRLDPVDLGRIDVRLEIDKDRGTVTTSVVVDRADTLALLQRDSGNLQQALAQAGLDPGAGISLSLRSDGMGADQRSGDPRPEGRDTDGRGGSPKADSSVQQPLTDYVAPRMLRGIAGIDIRI